jgi:prepilin-type N-terminal cleavage/methylation domain-containing protein
LENNFGVRAKTRSVSPAGFTLIELMVVSTIILLLTAFIFFQQGKFNSTTILRSLTYSVALSVRQAQVYGTSVRGLAVTQASCAAGTYSAGVCFSPGYGIYIPSVGALADTYYIFSDLNGNGAYESGEALPIYKLGTSYRLKSVCTVAGGSSVCNAQTSLTIYFRRPNPDACMSTPSVPGACALDVTPSYSRAYITVGNTSNSDSRSLKITDTGQITVCPPNLSDVTQC